MKTWAKIIAAFGFAFFWTIIIVFLTFPELGIKVFNSDEFKQELQLIAENEIYIAQIESDSTLSEDCSNTEKQAEVLAATINKDKTRRPGLLWNKKDLIIAILALFDFLIVLFLERRARIQSNIVFALILIILFFEFVIDFKPDATILVMIWVSIIVIKINTILNFPVPKKIEPLRV